MHGGGAMRRIVIRHTRFETHGPKDPAGPSTGWYGLIPASASAFLFLGAGRGFGQGRATGRWDRRANFTVPLRFLQYSIPLSTPNPLQTAVTQTPNEGRKKKEISTRLVSPFFSPSFSWRETIPHDPFRDDPRNGTWILMVCRFLAPTMVWNFPSLDKDRST